MNIRAILFFCFSLCWATLGSASPSSPLDYLKAMNHAHKKLNYELLYFFQRGDETETFRYRHAIENGERYAQQLRLDFMREEIILRDHSVHYFSEFQPLRLPNSEIIDNFPLLLSANFEQLSENYHFIDVGKNRVADRLTRGIRVVPKDDFRYQYTVWVDEENFLLLKADLTDRENQLLEQFRVVQSVVSDELQGMIDPIRALALPPRYAGTQTSTATPFSWQLNWLPSGFKEIQGKSTSALMDFSNGENVESRFYSDGLFSFSVYVADNQGMIFNEQFWRDGKLSIYSQTVDDKDIIIIGEIPLVSARHILQEMRPGTPLVKEHAQ